LRDQVIQQRRIGRFVHLAPENLAGTGDGQTDDLMTKLLTSAVGLLLNFSLGDR